MTAHQPSSVDPAASGDPAPPSDNARREDGDWLTCAVIFAILGACLALWFGEVSLITTSLAALVSGLGGVLFSEI